MASSCLHTRGKRPPLSFALSVPRAIAAAHVKLRLTYACMFACRYFAPFTYPERRCWLQAALEISCLQLLWLFSVCYFT